ncbi:CD36 [Balamuthia mandrillaris]
MRRPSWRTILISASFCLGFVLIVTGVLVSLLVASALDKGLQEKLVVDSTGSDGYDSFVKNTAEDDVPLYYCVYLWDLQNLDEIKQNPNAVPSYKEKGPYCHREYKVKLNVTFQDHGKNVSYAEWTYYVHDPEHTKAPLTENITAMNYFYLGAVMQAGSESALAGGVSTVALHKMFQSISTPFMGAMVSGEAALELSAGFEQVLSSIMQEKNVTKDEAKQEFYTIWANSTSVPDDSIWVKVFGGVPSADVGPTNISAAVAAALWANDTVNVPSLTNYTSSLTAALLWGVAGMDSPYAGMAKQLLQAAFTLTPTQLDMIINWRNSMMFSISLPTLLQKYSFSSPDDIIYAQWGGVALYPAGVQALLQAYFPLPVVFELPIWAKSKLQTDISFNHTYTKFLLGDPDVGIFNTTHFAAFAAAVINRDQETLTQRWKITLPEAAVVLQYMQYVGQTIITQTFAQGSGLFSTKTAEEWLWGFKDPLLTMLSGGTKTTFSYCTNQTSEEEVLKSGLYDTLNTGAGKLRDTHNFVQSDGKTVLPAGHPWPREEKVRGSDGHAFEPILDGVWSFTKAKPVRSGSLLVWLHEALRAVPLLPSESIELHGIPLRRYRPEDKIFDINPDYNQYIVGFANMSSALPANLPLFLSRPQMFKADPYYREQRVHGMSNITTDPQDIYSTYIDVESITGKAMQARKRVQANIFLQNSTSSALDLFNTNIPKDVMYPIYWGAEESTLTKGLADDYQKSVLNLLLGRIILFWTLLSVGAVLLLVGVAWVVFMIVRQRVRSSGYVKLDYGDVDYSSSAY